QNTSQVLCRHIPGRVQDDVPRNREEFHNEGIGTGFTKLRQQIHGVDMCHGVGLDQVFNVVLRLCEHAEQCGSDCLTLGNGLCHSFPWKGPRIGGELLKNLLDIHRLSLLPTGLTSYDHTAHAPENHLCSRMRPVIWCMIIETDCTAHHAKGLQSMQPAFTPA